MPLERGSRRSGVGRRRGIAAEHRSGGTPSALPPAQGSVGELTYRRVRSDIVFGRLTPGRKLTLDRMRDAYGTSVSTLRELFSRLTSEGLLVAEGSRGFEVAPVSVADLHDVASMRLLLESRGIEQSFARGDLHWEGQVVAAYHVLARAESKLADGERYSVETWREYDWAFHRALIGACGSRLLLETYASICDKYLRYLTIAAVFRGQLAADEHRVLLESALARDVARAQSTLATHIQACVAQMTTVLDARARKLAKS